MAVTTDTGFGVEMELSSSSDRPGDFLPRGFGELAESLCEKISKQDHRIKFKELIKGLAADHIAQDKVNQMESQQMAEEWPYKYDNVEVYTFSSDCIPAMGENMRKYADCDSWTVTSFPTTSDKVVMHLAVGVRTTQRVAIVMFDFSTREEKLTVFTNTDITWSVEDVSRPCILHITSSDVVFDVPDEQHAIKIDNTDLLKWLLLKDRKGGNLGKRLQSYLEKDQCLFHVAAEFNSSKVVEWLCNNLVEEREQLVKQLAMPDSNGNLPIHHAVASKSAAAVHQLLKPLSKQELENCLATDNEDILVDVMNSDPNDYEEVRSVIKYHKQIRDDEILMKFFDSFPYSLFSSELNPAKIHQAYKRIQDRSPKQPLSKESVNSDAAICLTENDMIRAKELIDEAISELPNSINTWCNRGKYLTMLEHSHRLHNEIMKAALKIIELLSDKIPEPKLQAKCKLAYFITEINRDAKSCQLSKNIFDECLESVEQCYKSRRKMKIRCYQSITATFVRLLKPDPKQEFARETIKENLHFAINSLAEMKNISKYPSEEAFVWRWLAEIQVLHFKPTDNPVNSMMEEFKKLTQLEDTSLSSCLLNLSKLIEEHEQAVDSYMRVHVARLCFNLVYDEDSQAKICHWLDIAYKNCRWWMENNNWTYKCATISANALWMLWNTEMFFKRNDLVKRTYTHIHEGKEITNNSMGIGFCRDEFYHPDLCGHEITRRRPGLPEAKQHLEILVKQHDGWKCHGLRLAKIKYLMNDPAEEIIDIFELVVEQSDAGKRKSDALAHYGFYQGLAGNREEAETLLNRSKKEASENCPHYKQPLARKGLILLEEKKPFYPGE